MPWPRVLAADGGLKDYKYPGGGWALIFRHPLKPLSPVGEGDLQEVLAFLKEEEQLTIGVVKPTTLGVVQADLGYGRKQGNIQLYVSKFGRSTGNLRINVGDEGRLREIRDTLLKSAWVVDCIPGGTDRIELVFQPDGKIILPCITEAASKSSLEQMFKTIKAKLGAKGKTAMADHIARCGLQPDSDIMTTLESVFAGRRSAGAG